MFAVLALLLISSQQTADSTRYVILNHGRPAGEMRIAKAGDSIVVRSTGRLTREARR